MIKMDTQRIIKGIKRKLYCYPLFYPKKKDNAVKWAIIGLGNMAEVFASALDTDADSKIVAVASRSIGKAKAFASRHGHSRAYGSYEDMLADASLQIDVVYIATPAKYHAEHIKMCLDAGKNVLCEKPISMSSDELSSLMQLAKEKDLFLMEGMWMKCLPTFRKAYEWVTQGRVGKLELIRANLFKREAIKPELNIFNAAEGGGVLRDYGVYAIAFVQAFMGIPDVKSVCCRKSSFDIDSDWQIFLEKNGIKAFVSLSSDFASSSKAALVGEEGTIEFESQFNRTNTISLYSKVGKLVDRCSFSYVSDGFEYEIELVGKLMREGKKESDIVSLKDSMTVLKIIDDLSK